MCPNACPVPERAALVVVTGRERVAGQRLTCPQRAAFGQQLSLIETFEEQQVGDLFDHLQWVGNAAGPESVPDPVDLVPHITGDHASATPSVLPIDEVRHARDRVRDPAVLG